MLTPERVNTSAKAVVCAHFVLREDADRKSAFCVPAKHEHSNPSRHDTHRMLTSRLVPPDLSTMARDRDVACPITRAVTGLPCLPMGRDDGRPQVRRMQATSASSM